MFIPTQIATRLAADSVAGRRGAATHRLTIPNPFSGMTRAWIARRPAPCATC